MKATINKSQLMKRAWNIFRGNNAWSGNFSVSLRRAWEIEKANIAYEAKKAAEAAEMTRMEAIRKERQSNPQPDYIWGASMGAAIADWYANAPRGTYFSD